MHTTPFGLLLSSYWTGPTGQQIQAKGRDAVILGAYLGSSKHANMIGLYELPLAYVDHDLPVLDGAANIRAAFAALADVAYAFYDDVAEVVWVVEMARIRCGLIGAHSVLSSGDKKRDGVARLYARVKPNRFLQQFHTRYSVQLQLEVGRLPYDGRPPKGLQSPSDGASKELAGGLQAPPIDLDLDQDLDHVRTEVRYAPAAQTSRPKNRTPQPNVPNVALLAALIRDEVLPLHLDDEGDVIEAAKRHAARRRLPYTSTAIRRALASAIGQRR